MREAVCMGDYCKVAQLRSTSDKLKSSTGLQRSVAKGGPDLTRSNASLVSGASLGDLVTQSDGTVMSLAEVVEGNGRKKSSMMPAIKLGDGEDDEDGAADGAADEADTSEQSFATRGLAAALAETAAAAPTHRIAYRAILLDRTLRGLGIEEDDPSPPGVLQQFEAKTRRRMDLYYHQAHVCAACAQWYERQSRRRAAELELCTGVYLPEQTLAGEAAPPGVRRSSKASLRSSGASGISTTRIAERASLPTTEQAAAMPKEPPGSLQRAMVRTSVSLPSLKPPHLGIAPRVSTGRVLQQTMAPADLSAPFVPFALPPVSDAQPAPLYAPVAAPASAAYAPAPAPLPPLPPPPAPKLLDTAEPAALDPAERAAAEAAAAAVAAEAEAAVARAKAEEAAAAEAGYGSDAEVAAATEEAPPPGEPPADLVRVSTPVQADGSVAFDLDHPDGTPGSPSMRSRPATADDAEVAEATGEAAAPSEEAIAAAAAADLVRVSTPVQADGSVALDLDHPDGTPASPSSKSRPATADEAAPEAEATGAAIAAAEAADLVRVSTPVQADGTVAFDVEHPDGTPASP